MSDGASFLLGARIRQLRMPQIECKIPEMVKQYFSGCIGIYSVNEQDEADYEVGWESGKSGSAGPEFSYNSAVKLAGEPTKTLYATYSGGGYVADLGRDGEAARDEVDQLAKSNWLDNRTSAIFIEFFAYNANTQLHTAWTATVEFFVGGGLLVSESVETLNLNRYAGESGTVRLVLHLLTIAVLFCYLFGEIMKLYELRCEYLKV